MRNRYSLLCAKRRDRESPGGLWKLDFIAATFKDRNRRVLALQAAQTTCLRFSRRGHAFRGYTRGDVKNLKAVHAKFTLRRCR